MLILYRYLATTIILASLLTLLVLLGMDFFIQIASEVMDMGHGNYGLWQAFQCALYRLPSALYDFLPMAGLIGTMFGLSNLAMHHELIAMEAGGMSRWRIIGAVLVTILGLVFLSTLIGETAGPYLLRRADMIKINAKSHGQAIHTAQGLWFRDGKEFIHVAYVTPQHELQDIARYTFNSHYQLEKVSFAKQGTYTHKQWKVSEVQETVLTPHRTRVQKKSIDFWPLQLKPEFLKAIQVDSKAMTLPQLLELIRYKKANHVRYELEALTYWQRILAPFALCVMMFLAVPFVFGPLRNATLSVRIVVGLFLGFGFYTLNQFLGPVSLVYGLPPLLGAILPMLSFTMMGILIFLRTKKVA